MDALTYPKATIILSYVFIAAPLGGLLFGFSFVLMLILYHSTRLEDLLNYLGIIAGMGVLGLIIGALPALFTALVICHKALVITSKLDYLRIFGIGGLFGMLPPLVAAIVLSDLKTAVFMPFFFSLGGLCAVSVAPFVIPKSPNNNAKVLP